MPHRKKQVNSLYVNNATEGFARNMKYPLKKAGDCKINVTISSLYTNHKFILIQSSLCKGLLRFHPYIQEHPL